MMIESLSSPVITCLLAVGKVKWYQIIVGGLLIMNLPVSYIALKLGAKPETTIEIAIIISFASLLIRLFMLNRKGLYDEGFRNCINCGCAVLCSKQFSL